MTIKNIYLDKIISDDELKSIKGDYLDDAWIFNHLTGDCNVYDKQSKILICSLRKKRIKQNDVAWNSPHHERIY